MLQILKPTLIQHMKALRHQSNAASLSLPVSVEGTVLALPSDPSLGTERKGTWFKPGVGKFTLCSQVSPFGESASSLSRSVFGSG